MSAACPRRWLIVSLTVCSCAAGCGSTEQHAAPSPQLPRPLAQRLAHEANLVAARWQAGDRSGAERIAAFRQSAATWRSWPQTSFTRREEQKDLDAAGR